MLKDLMLICSSSLEEVPCHERVKSSCAGIEGCLLSWSRLWGIVFQSFLLRPHQHTSLAGRPAFFFLGGGVEEIMFRCFEISMFLL